MATRYDRDYRRDYARAYDRGRAARHPAEDRGFIERASDEVRSWFGDEEAERRRRMEERRDEQYQRERAYTRSRYDFDDVRAREVMTRNVITVHPDDTVQYAARLMGEGDCGAVPVVDRGGRLIGVVTDRDITVRIVGHGLDPRRALVEECMTGDAFACHTEDSIVDCLRQMSRHQVRRMPIIDDRDRLVGIVSQGDLARHAGAYQGRGERRAFADTLCAISEPSRRAYR